MGTVTKAERTRQFIIEKSASLFNIKGYDSTSMSDIQEATKLSRGALYGNFADKNELAVAAYEYNYSGSVDRTKKALEKSTSAKSKLLAYTKQYVKNWDGVSERGGCPMLNASVEADDHLHFLKDTVRSSIKSFIKMLQDIVEEGKTNEEFKKEIKAGDYAALFFSIVEGNIMLAKIMDNPKFLYTASDRIKRIIEQELEV